MLLCCPGRAAPDQVSSVPLWQLYQIQPSHSQQMWVIDMVCLHNMNLVAVASTDQKIGESPPPTGPPPAAGSHALALGEICRSANHELDWSPWEDCWVVTSEAAHCHQR